jgi:hypothetical protein
VFAIQAQRAGTKISPARKGWVHRQAVERWRCGTTLFVCSSREPVTFSIFSCFLHFHPARFQAPDKTVILSEALRRSIANRGLYGAESKDPGDACWQMLLGAFRPQTTTEDKKVTNSERTRISYFAALISDYLCGSP